jgi:hypothetical protein
MLRNRKVQVIGVVLLLFCTVLVVAQEGSVPVRVNVAITCNNDGVCYYEVFNVRVSKSDYSLSDIKAKIEAECGRLYFSLRDWKMDWKDRNECSISIKATYKF